jgi:CubicO group peptidase (beta-lactamase class C family)
MVATVIARLAEAGRLSIDDPVVARVPELRRSRWAEHTTLRDLLANRSGLPLRAGLEFGFAGRKDEDDGALSRLAADIPAGALTADFWSYTNVGWCVLGRVIETATEAVWEDAVRSHFSSAGMCATTFAIDAAPKRRASGHNVTADGPVPVRPLIARAYFTGAAACRRAAVFVRGTTDARWFRRTRRSPRRQRRGRGPERSVRAWGWTPAAECYRR